MPEVSIIIPTFNEEKRLELLLQSLSIQDYKDYEIIVSDNGSKDNTLKIAQKYHCKIAKGGLPARGRNNGAKIAKGRILIFMDADTVLERGSLSKLVGEFKIRDLDCGSVLVKPFQGLWIDKVLYWIWNFWAFSTQLIYPHGTGAFIICKKKAFNTVRGFDESIKVGEDHHFVAKVRLHGYKYRILLHSKISISVRRLEAEGRAKVFLKVLFLGFHRTFIGELRREDFGYNFEYRKKFN